MRLAAALLALAATLPAWASAPRLSSAALAPPPPRPVMLSPAASGAVAGRARGIAVDCIDQARPRAVRIVDRTAILWEMSPRRWYMNVVARGCPLSVDRIVVTQTGASGRICRNDRVRLIERTGGGAGASCRLGPFIPYTR